MIQCELPGFLVHLICLFVQVFSFVSWHLSILRCVFVYFVIMALIVGCQQYIFLLFHLDSFPFPLSLFFFPLLCFLSSHRSHTGALLISFLSVLVSSPLFFLFLCAAMQFPSFLLSPLSPFPFNPSLVVWLQQKILQGSPPFSPLIILLLQRCFFLPFLAFLISPHLSLFCVNDFCEKLK